MSWLKQGPAVQEGPGAAVDLRDLEGLPGHLLFANSLRAHQMVSLPCRVLRVDRLAMVVELTGGTDRPRAESAVIVEVLHHSAVIQCFTTVERADRGGPLLVRIPARPHVVKRRRNQRVDMFMGVTLNTPSRPIEETPAQLINLSPDGAACVVAEPLAPGAAISINMAPLGVTPHAVPATVVRCVPTPTHLWVIGVRFGQLSPEQESYLSQYITDFMESVRQSPGEGFEG